MLILQSLLGVGYSGTGSAALPLVAVAALLAIGLAGHVAHRIPAARPLPTMRGLGYAAAVVLLVTLGPGATKGFIYIVFLHSPTRRPVRYCR